MKERTLVIIKPDAIERKIVGKIIENLEKKGFRIVAAKILKVGREMAQKQYPKSKSQILGMGNKTLGATPKKEIKRIFRTENPWKIGLMLRRWLIEYIISAPVIAIVFEGENAVKRVRELAGFTDPIKARKGTIRGDFGIDSILKANRERRAVKNVVHVSGSREEARKEIKLWFKKNEIM